MNLNEETLKSERLYEGKIINLRKDTVRLPDGSESKREIIEHRGAVAIVAVDDDDNVLIVNQYRKAFDAVTTEIPAGKLEDTEHPRECALRELEEETGYTAKNLISLGDCLPSPGYTNEEIYIFYASDLEFKGMKPDKGEFLEIKKIPFNQVLFMVADNLIYDAKTQIGILKAKFIRDKGLMK